MKLHTRVFAVVVAHCFMLLAAHSIQAQQRFELQATHLGIASQAVLSANGLQVVSTDGIVTNYRRDTRFDSQDGSWKGFYSRDANQILRWPATNSGNMQIGIQRGSKIQYQVSQMTIHASRPLVNQSDGRISQRPVLPPPMPGGAGSTVSAQSNELLANLAFSQLFASVSTGGLQIEPQMLRIATYDASGSPWVLTRADGFNLSCINRGAATGTDWLVAPAGGGFVRVETYDRGRVLAVSANRAGSLSLLPLSQDPRQLWRVAGGGRIANRFVLESVAFAGKCLAHQGSGRILLQSINYNPMQLWMPFVAPPVATFQPFIKSISTEVLPNSQLPPARLELENTHRYALILLLGDSRRGSSFEQIRIEPSSSVAVELDRDAGATMVETVEIRTPGGIWERQEYVTAIPPSAFYDLSVYEEHLQSIAIDATGKSPNPVEDINYVPKSIGWLPLPAGSSLPATGRLDIYPLAKSANNPGAVRRMNMSQLDEQPTENPLESILEKYQSVPRRKF